ncbi:MAG: YdcF family protein [Thermomicrobiales bacterium]
MNDSGATSRLPDPAPQTPPSPETRPRQQGSLDNPTWLTESPYAHPLTDASGNVRNSRRSTSRRWLKSLVLLFALMIPFSIGLVGVAVYWEARNAEAREAGAIVVMGAAQFDGRPSNVFEARLEQALDLYERGFAPLILLTGGNMPGDAFTEAETGAQYLVERGVPETAIRWENRGRDSWQSMRGVAAMLEGSGVGSLLIVSDGFHLLRSELMARELGFTAFGSAVPESPIRPWSAHEFSYVIRETGGILALVPTLVGLD